MGSNGVIFNKETGYFTRTANKAGSSSANVDLQALLEAKARGAYDEESFEAAGAEESYEEAGAEESHETYEEEQPSVEKFSGGMFDPKNHITFKVKHPFQWQNPEAIGASKGEAVICPEQSFDVEELKNITGIKSENLLKKAYVISAKKVGGFNTSPHHFEVQIRGLEGEDKVAGNSRSASGKHYTVELLPGEKGASNEVFHTISDDVSEDHMIKYAFSDFVKEMDEAYMKATGNRVGILAQSKLGELVKSTGADKMEGVSPLIEIVEQKVDGQIQKTSHMYGWNFTKKAFKHFGDTYQKNILAKLPVTDLTKLKASVARDDGHEDLADYSNVSGLSPAGINAASSAKSHKAYVQAQYTIVNPAVFAPKK